ncbi:hypothetical protein QFZ81_003648 [Paenibacillus sp. V4I9]|nr:hypothetical protein [Paenibacillus sp. V4I9]
MVTISNSIVIAFPIHFMAWVIIICSLAFEPFSWFLIPNVNNTPAFITVSKWLVQSLIVTNLFGYSVYKLRTSSKLSKTDWSVISVHIVFSIIHIVVVSALIIMVAGFEDL